MRKLVAILFLLVAPAVFAQGGAPAQTGASHFSVNASAVGFTGANTASVASIAGGSVALTPRFALGYEQVIIPNLNATYYIGTLNYTIPLAVLVGKKVNSKFVFNSSKWSTTFFGGGGVLRQTLTSATTDPTTGAVSNTSLMAQHVAVALGMGLNYVADNHVTIQVVSGQWLHAGVAGQVGNSFVVTPSTTAIATGLRISF